MRFHLVASLFFLLISLSSGAEAQSWQPAGGPFGGIMDCLYQDVSTGYVYCGGLRSGVFSSTDEGVTWNQVNLAIGNDAVMRFGKSGAGNLLAITRGGGVQQSTDNGLTWAATNAGITNLNLQSFAMTSSNALFVGSEGDGIFRSVDDGANWTVVNNGLGELDVYAMLWDPSGYLYAGTYGGGVYVSLDDGETWNPASNGIPAGEQKILSLLRRKSGAIVAGTAGGDIYQTTDNGANWSPLGLKVRAAALEENSDGDLLVGEWTGGMHKLPHSGGSWISVNEGIYIMDIRSILRLQNGHLLAALFGSLGVERSTDGGEHWFASNDGLTGQDMIMQARLQSGKLYCSGDNGGLQHSTNHGVSWTPDSTAFNAQRMYSFLEKSNGKLFAGTSYPYRSDDSGKTWAQKSSGMAGGYIYALLESGAGGMFAAGATGVYFSSDNGESWAHRDSGITTKSARCLVRLANGDLIAGTAGQGIYRSTDNGSFWSVYAGLPGASVAAFFLHPNGTVFAGTFSGLYRSTDGGVSWISSGLGQSANAFALAPTGSIYAATNYNGVYVSTDGGGSWSTVNSGLPTLSLNTLILAGDNRLLVGTHSASLYRSTYAVPVELASFTAERAGSRVRLLWSTASETNNFGFRIERSPGDAAPSSGGWQERGFVPGSGTASSAHRYEFTEDLPSPIDFPGGAAWYRLRQTDVDGSSTLSEAVKVDLPPAPSAIGTIGNNPNPFREATTVTFEVAGEAPMRVRLSLRDLLGRELRLLAEGEFAPGRHEMDFAPPASLRSGTYVLSMETAEGRAIRRIVLLR